MANLFLVSFLISLTFCFIIIFLFNKSLYIGSDHFDGPQKFHDRPTQELVEWGFLSLFHLQQFTHLFLEIVIITICF